MLVTFSCNAHENVTLFGAVAERLLHLMGNSGAVPGALVAEDVPEALERLKHAIELEKVPPAQNALDDEPEVSLRHRALPVIALLEDAEKHKCSVMWDKR